MQSQRHGLNHVNGEGSRAETHGCPRLAIGHWLPPLVDADRSVPRVELHVLRGWRIQSCQPIAALRVAHQGKTCRDAARRGGCVKRD